MAHSGCALAAPASLPLTLCCPLRAHCTGEVVPPSLGDNLTRLIAEGTGDEDEGADRELRAGAVEAYLALLDKPKLPRVLLKVGGRGWPCCV